MFPLFFFFAVVAVLNASASSLLRSIGVITYILWVIVLIIPACRSLLTHKWLHSTCLYFICAPEGWVALHLFSAKPSRRLSQTSQASTMTLMRNTSATPVSWQKTSYAVCWSRTPSTKCFYLFVDRQWWFLLTWAFLFAFCRKRMKIDDSLEHPWIKVSWLIRYFPVVFITQLAFD